MHKSGIKTAIKLVTSSLQLATYQLPQTTCYKRLLQLPENMQAATEKAR
jgi:hypothetical protein